MKIRYSYIIWVIVFLIAQEVTWAAHSSGFGGVAENLMEPVTVLSDFVGSAAIIIGMTCLFAAVIKYTQHRVSPLQVPISTVIVLLIIGIILLLLPLTYKITEGGVPYHYFYKQNKSSSDHLLKGGRPRNAGV